MPIKSNITENAELVRAEFIREVAMRLFIQEACVTKEPFNKFMTKCIQRAFDFTSMLESYKNGEVNFEKCATNGLVKEIEANSELIQNLFGQMQNSMTSMQSEMSSQMSSMNNQMEQNISSMNDSMSDVIDSTKQDILNEVYNKFSEVNDNINNINTNIDNINNKIGEISEDKSISE